MNKLWQFNFAYIKLWTSSRNGTQWYQCHTFWEKVSNTLLWHRHNASYMTRVVLWMFKSRKGLPYHKCLRNCSYWCWGGAHHQLHLLRPGKECVHLITCITLNTHDNKHYLDTQTVTRRKRMMLSPVAVFQPWIVGSCNKVTAANIQASLG